MPTSFEFLTFSEPNGMRHESTKSRIRKQAMKDIGVTRRRPPGSKRSRFIELSLRPATELGTLQIQEQSIGHAIGLDATDTLQADDSRQQLIAYSSPEDYTLKNDAALYDPCVRALSCKLDPFSTASVHIDNTARGLLQYFIYYSSNFPNPFTYSLGSNPHNPSLSVESINGTVDAAMQDDLLMNCLLGAAASRVLYIDNVAFLPYKKREAYSMDEALRLLQHRLKVTNPQSSAAVERLLSCIMHNSENPQ